MSRTAPPDREARLKAALKANMGRRKAQARVRADEAPVVAKTADADRAEKAPDERKDERNG
ncbi:MAG: hypothetical protein WBA25_13945 [Jannaschia sp.]